MKRFLRLISIPLLSLIILYSFSGCFRCLKPTDGVWVCEERGIVLSFGGENRTSVLVDGVSIHCSNELVNGHEGRSSNLVLVVFAEGENLADIAFKGECVYADENRILIKESGTNEDCWFYRVE